jgi:hypothetical protein
MTARWFGVFKAMGALFAWEQSSSPLRNSKVMGTIMRSAEGQIGQPKRGASCQFLNHAGDLQEGFRNSLLATSARRFLARVLATQRVRQVY